LRKEKTIADFSFSGESISEKLTSLTILNETWYEVDSWLTLILRSYFPVFSLVAKMVLPDVIYGPTSRSMAGRLLIMSVLSLAPFSRGISGVVLTA
jgi:hypothetical protein